MNLFTDFALLKDEKERVKAIFAAELYPDFSEVAVRVAARLGVNVELAKTLVLRALDTMYERGEVRLKGDAS